jgi:hypothetical protein
VREARAMAALYGTWSDFSEVEQGAEHGFVLTSLDLAPDPGVVIGVRLNPV